MSEAELTSVSEAAQRALLRPKPRQIGPLHIACAYLAAEREAHIGGDLYAVARRGNCTRLIVGDVRGKGLGAVEEASALIGAFREAAHRQDTLTDLARALNCSVCRHTADLLDMDSEAEEHFVTALLPEIPDDAPTAQLTPCGHPPLLLIAKGQVTCVAYSQPEPPLGVWAPEEDAHAHDTFAFRVGDTLLLYTDGVIEARDDRRIFYPLKERPARGTKYDPEALVDHVRRDLLAHTNETLQDDAALIAIRKRKQMRSGHADSLHVPTDLQSVVSAGADGP
ncbi:PP2C family protein-serine/threonine phosphatase [Streptomyces sp. NPDC046994]|uniref:PP2C family protein-serine/threonine phosphatase n=1 Tax=Streptomyces sp. NPDC046994 TaxID=3155735 RepID=UPI0034523818